MKQQIDQTVAFLSRDQNLHKGVHNARRRLKIIRAIWRLVEDHLGKEEYKVRNRFYRDEARKLSALRDATAVLQTLDNLQSRYLGVKHKPAFKELRTVLDEERSQLVIKKKKEGAVLKKIARSLEGSKKKYLQFDIGEDYLGRLVSSFRNAYETGHKLYTTNSKMPSAAQIHEWRKQVKYLRHQLFVLQYAWRPLYLLLGEEFHKLSDLLGNYQNLTILKEKLEEHEKTLAPATTQKVLDLASRQQEVLLESALPLGLRLYAESPEAFGKRNGVYLRDWLKA